ncbi:uncharacterized protein EKO05_0007636 [Ascochyta rabiei]|nr:uncharacterized protein EKO05_0007636 [Ascochyta rabiei]UPX17270.1 hypothetical protein EKO05_0007636 [Ascochyta rabiei]
MVTKLTGEINAWTESHERKMKEARRQEAMQHGLTAEQKAADDEWKDVLSAYSDQSSYDKDAGEVDDCQDVDISWSPSPSKASSDALLSPNSDSSHPGICGSSAIPMGPYPHRKHPTLQPDDSNASEDQVDDRAGCRGWGVWDLLTCLQCR